MMSVFTSALMILKFLFWLFSFFVNLFSFRATEAQYGYCKRTSHLFQSFSIFDKFYCCFNFCSMYKPVVYFAACSNPLSRDNYHEVIYLREQYVVVRRS